MRFAAYAGASTALAAGVVLRAFHQRPNFYSASVYLAQSQACRMILLNLVLLSVYSCVRALQKLLYGPLRPIEREQLWDRSWYAVTETALAMTTFRDEVGVFFLIMFVTLLAGKVWGWISEGRVEILEQQPPANPRLFHSRLVASLFVSELFDILMLRYCVNSLLEQPRPGMMVMFAFEFAVLLITSTSTAARYCLSLHESLVVQQQTRAKLEERRAEIRTARQEAERQAGEDSTAVPLDLPREEDVDQNDIDVPGWQEKGRWILFLDLLTDFMKLSVYVMFFTMLLLFHGIPIHILRDVYLTARSFFKRINDFQKYRNATRDMNARYADATLAELERDGTCIICREDMRPWQQEPNGVPEPGADAAAGPRQANRTPPDERQRPKKLPCGHILHLGCLKSWLERQQVCPTCRTSVLAPSPTANNAQNQNQNQNGDLNQNQNQNQNLPPHLQPGGPEQRGVEEQNNVWNQRNIFQRGAQRPANAGANQAGQGARQPRARTFNLGPWRFTFATGNANQVRDAFDRARPPERVPAANYEHNAQIGMGEVLRRWDLERPHSIRGLGALREALLNLEAIVIHEVNTLQITQAQLFQLRAMQAELARLREMQAQLNATARISPRANVAAANAAPVGPAQAFPPPAMPGTVAGNAIGTQPGLPRDLNLAQHEQQQVFATGAEGRELGPGDPELPPGITLPEGWSLLPLDRAGDVGQITAVPTPAEQMGGVEVTPQIQVPGSVGAPVENSTASEQNGTGANVEDASLLQSPIPNGLEVPTAAVPTTVPPSGRNNTETDPGSLRNGWNQGNAQSEEISNIPDWSQGSGNQIGESSSAAAVVNGATAPESTRTTATTNEQTRTEKNNGKAATVEDSDDLD